MASNVHQHLDQIDDSLCVSCFDAVYERLFHHDPIEREALSNLIAKNVVSALFVTFMIKSQDGKHEELRGCIGTLEPVPIVDLKQYAQLSVFSDSRFEPLERHEFKHLSCRVSLLHSFEKSKNYNDWELGVHGIIIDFYVGGRGYKATYLPEVPSEHGMNKETTIHSLIRKAGYRGSITDQILSTIKVTRYQSKKIRMDYNEYERYIPK